MRYVSRTLIGLGLFAFCWAVTAYAIFQLLSIGTCASGGPYVPARQCPAGTERVMLALVGAILLYFVAALIYSTRGPAPGSKRPPSSALTILWFWTGLFWSLAVGSFLAVWGPEANPGPGATLGGLIVGFMGLIFGIAGVAWVGYTWRSGPRTIAGPDWSVFGTPRRPDRAGAFNALATLERMRDEGNLDDAEFETLRARLRGP
ncbi:MAG: hypothetical protein ACJ75R_07520 [Solirubrobacterales bacterium]